MSKVTKEIKNIDDVRTAAVDIFQDLKDKKLGSREADSMNKVLGTVISSVKVELEEAKINKREANIAFLKY